MLRRIATFFLLALAATTLGLPDTAVAAGFRGGFRGGPAFHGPVMRGLPRPAFRGHTAVPRTIPQARRAVIPPSAQGFGTVRADRPFGTVRSATGAFGATTPLTNPFGRLVRRQHQIHHAGRHFPGTFGDGAAFGYFGTPYDPSEAIPVYGPAPSDPEPAVTDDGPAPRAALGTAARITGPAEENRDACRAEKVTVPSGESEREITVVRC